MAEEKDLELDKPGKSKKMIIIAAVVAVILLAAGAGFFFMGGSDSSTQAEFDAALDTADPANISATAPETSTTQAGTALYVPMPRPFRFNVPGAARDRFVEIRVQLLVRGSDNEETAKKHIPLLESTMLGIFSQANADDLSTSAGKASLKQKALVEAQKTMMDIAGNKIIEQVLFTGFVMQ